MSDGLQGMLFGSTNVVDDQIATREIRVLGLNVEGAPAPRRDDLLDWLYGTQCNVLVLSEVKLNDNGARLMQELHSSGFHLTHTDAATDDRYRVLVATKGFPAEPVPLQFVTPRLAAVRLATHLGPLDIVGLYSLTNGMSADSSAARRAFQDQVIDALAARATTTPNVPMLLAGDLNILEPGHRPPSELFEEHDYAFYRRLLSLGTVDAYRHLHPEGVDLSWYGPQGGQRLDHAFLSTALADRVHACGFEHDVRTRRISDHSAMTVVVK